MAWSSKTSSTQLTSITTEQFFSQTPVLNPGETAHVEVDANFPASPTDHLVVAVYGTLDAATEDWDDTPYMQFEIDNATDPNKASFLVSGVYKFRVGVRRSGTTDTITSADMAHRLDGVSL
jgi:hypothetical protein